MLGLVWSGTCNFGSCITAEEGIAEMEVESEASETTAEGGW